jgi:hypothetical protein
MVEDGYLDKIKRIAGGEKANSNFWKESDYPDDLAEMRLQESSGVQELS